MNRTDPVSLHLWAATIGGISEGVSKMPQIILTGFPFPHKLQGLVPVS